MYLYITLLIYKDLKQNRLIRSLMLPIKSFKIMIINKNVYYKSLGQFLLSIGRLTLKIGQIFLLSRIFFLNHIKRINAAL